MNKAYLSNYIWWALLALLLLATPIIGTISASIILILSILSAPFILNKNAFDELKKQPMIIIFSTAFIIFAFFTALSSKSPKDLLVIFAFMPFLTSALAYILAQEYAKKYGGKKAAILILSICLIGSGLAVLISLIDIYFLNSYRPRGFFSGVITLAMVGATLGFVAGMGFFLIDGFKKVIFILGPIFAIIVITLTQSRGTAIALPAIVFLYFIYSLRRTKTLKTKIITILTLLSLAFLSFLFITQSSGRIANLSTIINQIMDKDISSLKANNIRLEMFQAGWELFLSSPIFGYGWTNMSEMAFTILDKTKYNAALIHYFHFHNDFINFAFSIGIIGIAVFFAFLLAPIIGALKSPHDNLFGFRIEIILLMLCLYSIVGLTAGILSHGLLITLYAFISALILGAMRNEI